MSVLAISQQQLKSLPLCCSLHTYISPSLEQHPSVCLHWYAGFPQPAQATAAAPPCLYVPCACYSWKRALQSACPSSCDQLYTGSTERKWGQTSQTGVVELLLEDFLDFGPLVPRWVEGGVALVVVAAAPWPWGWPACCQCWTWRLHVLPGMALKVALNQSQISSIDKLPSISQATFITAMSPCSREILIILQMKLWSKWFVQERNARPGQVSNSDQFLRTRLGLEATHFCLFVINTCF